MLNPEVCRTLFQGYSLAVLLGLAAFLSLGMILAGAYSLVRGLRSWGLLP